MEKDPDQKDSTLSRRAALRLGTQFVAATVFGATTFASPLSSRNARWNQRVFDVRDYGAIGDGKALDTAAIQRTINEAATVARGAQVLIRGGRYLTGTLELKGGINLHLAGDAELVVSTNPKHYTGAALLTAHEAHGLRISGTGSINGRAKEFMTHYDEENEWWRPAEFRPKMFVLTGCKDLEVRDLTVREAPHWGLHMLGCVGVLVENLKIRNLLEVPNCDGIDPDHCRDVEIRGCNIVCGDDAIVIKTTRQGAAYGPSARISVRDCVIETQDSGLKIGTETTQDIHDIRFERCEIRSSCRGLCIQLRDEGNIHNITFRDITFVSRYHSDPWWGRGEAISLTAIPRTPQTKVGAIRDVRIQNVKGRAENSVRISGSLASRIRDVKLENVAVTLDRWTKYDGGVFDNRPTTTQPGIETHGNPGFHVRYADNVRLNHCRVAWGQNRPDHFTYALEAQDVTGLKLKQFVGEAAHPARDKALQIAKEIR
jgi:polygalacturonase